MVRWARPADILAPGWHLEALGGFHSFSVGVVLDWGMPIQAIAVHVGFFSVFAWRSRPDRV
jgi:hypothetical protein